MLQADVYYRHHFPVLQADVYYRHHFPVLQTDVYYRHAFLCCRQTMYSFWVLLVTALAVVGVRGHAGPHGGDNVMQMNQQPPSSFHDPNVVGNQE